MSYLKTNILRDENSVVFGCGREECKDCTSLRDTVLERGGQFKKAGPSSTIETFCPGNVLIVTEIRQPGLNPGRKPLDPEFCRNTLCTSCQGIPFEKLLLQHVEAFPFTLGLAKLKESSNSCALCALVVSNLPDPSSFIPDIHRPISFRVSKFGQSVEVSFPSLENNYPNLTSARTAVLNVFTGHAELGASFEMINKLPNEPIDHTISRKWLSECTENHEKCKLFKQSSPSDKGPLRLIDVGPPDGSQLPRLVECKGENEEYFTLSYCWGNPSTITMTTRDKLPEFLEGIPMDSLSSVFRDAIHATRSMNTRYIWIDALCILQDVPEEKSVEIQRMHEIYAKAVMNISASLATSGESTLYAPRMPANLVKVSTVKSEAGSTESYSLYVTDQVLNDFASDVPNGVLGTRGWCFQERLLAQRILHFGRNQLHWECHEGIWSESCSERKWYDDFQTIDDGCLRESLRLESTFSNPSLLYSKSETLGEDATSEAEAGWKKMLQELENVTLDETATAKRELAIRRRHYDNWYSAVSAYTGRQLTNQGDKLPALAGAAVKFKSFIKDGYVVGLWVSDLVHGLLWSRRAFEEVEVNTSIARRPGVGGWGEIHGGPTKGWRGAPSWSWASVDGPVHWARDRSGPIYLGPYGIMTKPGIDETFSCLEWGAIRVQGLLLEMGRVSWLRDEAKAEETRSEFEKWLAVQSPRFRPQIDPDDPSWEQILVQNNMSRPLYFLLTAAIPFNTRVEDPKSNQEEDNQGASGLLLGYALMLRFWPGEGGFRRVGLAKVAIQDFMTVKPVDISIL